MKEACPICAVEDYAIIYERLPQYSGAKVVKCYNCSHIYTILDNNIDASSLYTDDDAVYKVVENRNSIFDKILNFEYSSVIKNINSLRGSKGVLLDFGSGKGKFANLAKLDGWTVKCVETSPDRAKYARKVYLLDVNSDFYSSGKIFNTDFDVITLFHVLEHLPEPVQLLRQLINDNLKRGGVAILEVPNFKSIQAGLAKGNWIHLDVPRHINHFTPEKLREVIAACNLIPVKSTYFSFHLGALGMVDSLLKIFGYRKNIIFELKNRKSFGLVLSIIVLLPFALLSESLASLFGKGGIVRIYCKRK